jgi:hypothetical protein
VRAQAVLAQVPERAQARVQVLVALELVRVQAPVRVQVLREQVPALQVQRVPPRAQPPQVLRQPSFRPSSRLVW